MGVVVFIAPTRVSWEALSAVIAEMASSSSCPG
jgi:hypothetical protein